MMLNRDFGATYMSYTFDKSNVIRFSFRSDSHWSSIYHNEKLYGKPIIELCPLDIVSRHKTNNFLIWDLYKQAAQPKIYREIMGMREDVGLLHGFTLSTHFSVHHDAIAIATSDKKNNIASRIITNGATSELQNYLIACRQAVAPLILNRNGISDAEYK